MHDHGGGAVCKMWIGRQNHAGLVDWFNASFPSLKNGFDSRTPLEAQFNVLSQR